MRPLVLQCPKCREMRVLRTPPQVSPPTCGLCQEPLLLFSVQVPVRLRPQTPVCPHCDQVTVQHHFSADDHVLATHHCRQHGDVVPVLVSRAFCQQAA